MPSRHRYSTSLLSVLHRTGKRRTRETMSNSAISINLVKKFIPLCTTITTKHLCEATSMSQTKKFHKINLTHSHISTPNPYNQPSSIVTVRCSSVPPEFPSTPTIEEQPSIPTEIPMTDPPPEFEPIPFVPEITQPITPEIPGPKPGPEFPAPPIPSPATPDIPDPVPPPDVVPPRPSTPREVPPPQPTPTPLDIPPPSSPPDIIPPPVGAFI
ncbi:hypothetical protein AQUCO_01700560v1 [Aquilegia coerulea]|uniref:Uncharacterized protein n=1 Tax=Aquilegia coerulea TaxID=218851 RepID=A0A2G5DNM6_AQUCA|nr:hypothetical protein AQUCO_01700560v1 [Aquilegia coerulea]